MINRNLNKPFHGDWRNLLKETEKNTVSCVVIDPPYGMGYKSNMRKEKQPKIAGDSRDLSLSWIYEWSREIDRVTKDDAHIYVFCSWHKLCTFYREIGRVFKIKNILVWDKKKNSMGDLKGDYAPMHELILFINKGKPLKGSRDGNIIRFLKGENVLHPTQKPVELIEYLITKSSERNEIVLDTFAGSFSTAKAALQTGRHFLASELSREHFEKNSDTRKWEIETKLFAD